MILVSTWVTFNIRISLSFLAGAVIGLGGFFLVARYGESPQGWWNSFFIFIGLNTGIAIAEAFLIRWPQKISLLNPITSLLKSPLITLPGLSDAPYVNNLPALLLCILPIQIVFLGSILIQKNNWDREFGRKRITGITWILIISTLINGLIFYYPNRGVVISVLLSHVYF